MHNYNYLIYKRPTGFYNRLKNRYISKMPDVLQTFGILRTMDGILIVDVLIFKETLKNVFNKKISNKASV